MLRKAQTIFLILFILASALLWAFQSQAMRRESDRPVSVQAEVALSLAEALDLSLAMGDGRRVNWEAVGF